MSDLKPKSLLELSSSVRNHIFKLLLFCIIFFIAALVMIPFTKENRILFIGLLIVVALAVYYIYNLFLQFSYGKIHTIEGKVISVIKLKDARLVENIYSSRKVLIKDDIFVYEFITSNKDIAIDNTINLYVKPDYFKNLRQHNGKYNITSYILMEILDATTTSAVQPKRKRKKLF